MQILNEIKMLSNQSLEHMLDILKLDIQFLWFE